jgi:hypothetical protein
MKKNETPIECPEYDGLLAGIEAAKEQVKKAGATAVGALFKKFFEEYPTVTAIGWLQYTPYFNDGESCEFSVREPYLTTKKDLDFESVSSLDDEEETGFLDSYSLKGQGKEALFRLARSMNDDIFETAFGDHVMVIATPAGFHVSEYDHD